jgi:glycosyltransferase involved in cell wall biosynthesis
VKPIYINGRFLTQSLTGVQRYAWEIVNAIDAQLARSVGVMPEIELLAPSNANLPTLSHINVRAVGRSSGHVWDQIDFAWASRNGVALSLASTGPIAHANSIVAIHDAAIYRVPDAFSAQYRTAHKALGWFLSRTAHLLTVSEFSREELSRVFAIEAQDIAVAPNGHEHLNLDPDFSIITRLGLTSRPFFLMLGSLTRNKNLGAAGNALKQLPAGSVALVAVGDHRPSVFGHVPLPTSPDLVAPGRLSDAEIAALMRHATAFVFPSLYEGFGIPPLEAMANDCPVLASTADAVMETCGDAAEYFGAADTARLAQLMGHALADRVSGEHWRNSMIARGRQRLSKFTWERSAKIVLQQCIALASSKSGSVQSRKFNA